MNIRSFFFFLVLGYVNFGLSLLFKERILGDWLFRYIYVYLL